MQGITQLTYLPQGGLEIPCKLIFSGESRLIVKLRNLLQEALTSGLLTSCNMDSEHQKKSPLKQPKKKRRLEQGDSESWVKFDGIELSQFDKEQLRDGKWLNDKHINFAHALLKKQFPHIDGWKETLLLHKMQEKIKQGVQIIHTCGNHWIVAANLESSKCEIKIYDSLYPPVDKDTQNTVLNLFETDDKPKIIMAKMCKQEGLNDCGLFAIAAATALACGLNPAELQQFSM